MGKQVSGATVPRPNGSHRVAGIRDSPYVEPAIVWQDVNSLVNAHASAWAVALFCFSFLFWSVCVQACIGFTKKQDNQIKQTCYAQASQIRAVRKKMCDIMTEEATKCDLKELVLKL